MESVRLVTSRVSRRRAPRPTRAIEPPTRAGNVVGSAQSSTTGLSDSLCTKSLTVPRLEPASPTNKEFSRERTHPPQRHKLSPEDSLCCGTQRFQMSALLLVRWRLSGRGCDESRIQAVVSPRRRHPKKEVEQALRHAESQGWTVRPTAGGHRWGEMRCPHSGRGVCRVSIWSTPTNPGNHANRLRQNVRNCPHQDTT